MKKRNNIFNNLQIQKVFSLFLSFLLIFPHTLVIAEAQEFLNEDTNETVTVTIEDHTTGEFVLEPTRVEKNGYINIEGALKNASEHIDVKTDMEFPSLNTSVKSVTSSDGKITKDNDKNQWDTFLNSKRYDDIDFVSVYDGDTIRLIYSSKDEDQLGVDGDTLQVNKDALATALGQVENIENISDALKDLHTKGLELLLNREATVTEVGELTEELNDALNPIIPAKSINITPKNAEINIGEATDLTAEVTPKNATGEVRWMSLDTEIATVDARGKVTGHQAGTVDIEAEIDGIKSVASVSVQEILAEELKFADESITINQGSSEKLDIIIRPENTTEPIVFTSDDEEIAEVDSRGVLVGKRPGETKVRVSVGDLKDSLSVKVEERDAYTKPTVVFEFADGRLLDANSENEFILSPLDIGKFVLKGAEDIDFIDGKPYWDAEQKVTEGNTTRTDTWVAANGTYQPHAPRTVSAKVFTSSPHTGANELITTFKIKTIPTNIVELKGFVDGQEVKQDELFNLAGSESKDIKIQGRKNGTTDFIDIPRQALTYKEVGQGNGYINGGTFGMNTGYDLPEGAEAAYQIALVDGNASFSFKSYSEKVEVTSFEVMTPKVVYIDKWNNLGGQYVGFLPGININPENATNSRLKWEALTPDVAEYAPRHNNGIVPKKAGWAKFLVTSEDNPKLKQEVALEFKYKNPLVLASIPEEEFVLEQYDDMELPIKIAPKNATEQRFNWSFSKEGIVDVDQRVYQENTSNVNSEVITKQTLVAEKIGTVTVTGTPVDDTAGAKKIEFKVTVTPSMTEENTEYLNLAIENKKHGLDYLKKQTLTSYGAEWNLFTLLRSGEKIAKEVRAAYVNDVINTLNNPSSRIVSTDYARMILALETAGYDVENIGGHNLVELLYTNQNLENYPSNHVMWTLIALDTKAHNIPEHAEWSREKLIQNILDYQSADGGFGLSKDDTVTSVDMTAMAIQSLAPYYENSLRKNVADEISETMKKEVDEAVEHAVNYLSEVMTFNAGFIAEGEENSNSVAQVVTALSSIQLNILEHEDFTRGDKNMLTNIEKFKVDGGYSDKENKEVNTMATVQVTYGLEAFQRFITGEKSLYDFTDVVEENEIPDDLDQDDGEEENESPEDSDEGEHDQDEIPEDSNQEEKDEVPGNSDQANEIEEEDDTNSTESNEPDNDTNEKGTSSELAQSSDTGIAGSTGDTNQSSTSDGNDNEPEEINQTTLSKTKQQKNKIIISLVFLASSSFLFTFKTSKDDII